MALERPYDRPNFFSTATSQYPLLSVKWGAPSLLTSGGAVTYAFSLHGAGTPTTITSADHHRAIAEAFAEWEAVADITFTRVADGADADIELRFQTIDRNGTLGYAQFAEPADGSSLITLDDAWIVFNTYEFSTAGTIRSAELAKFKVVALHEIGHAIGLEHTHNENDLMYPYYATDKSITQNDAAAAELMYGAPAGQPGLLVLGDDLSNALIAASTGQILFGEGGNDTLTGGLSADTLIGGTGDDVLSSGGGDDVLTDAFGDNTLVGGAGLDNLSVLEGSNNLSGGAGNDVLRGGIGDDYLSGGAGRDAIWGDHLRDWTHDNLLFFGNDTLDGGAGDDSLFGGFGRDVFVFAPGGGADDISPIWHFSGFDRDPDNFRVMGDSWTTVYNADFQPGLDKVDLTAFSFSAAEDVLSSLSDAPDHALFQAQGTTIRIWGVATTDLSIDDFIWV